MYKVKSKFDEYDQDRSGVIDYDEFKGMMRKIFQAHSRKSWWSI